MAYWWVNQKTSFRDAHTGGYLWCPHEAADGRVPHHWKAMEQVRRGDVIFSVIAGQIVAIAIAQGQAYDALRPPQSDDRADQEPYLGYRVDVAYQVLWPPAELANLVDRLRPLLPTKYSPMDRFGHTMFGYLFSLPPDAGNLLLVEAIGEQATFTSVVDPTTTQAALDSTEQQALVQSRRGQGPFRQQVLKVWGNQCAVTGCGLVELLRASHIKPLSRSSNQERLDPRNGLALAPNLDAVFDRGLVTFTPSGAIALAPRLAQQADEAALLGLHTGLALTKDLDRSQRAYLAYHNQHVFQGHI